ncbi:importin subunit alpha-8 [Echinops telfairi]|uniref:Importin subunit alpha-8 n=1 Tax=Echinops telfairi TaxID=9371 RepID=A0AC55CJM3_ECHTE|nr:importin subunit alpha-8 [Echinops telfairi]
MAALEAPQERLRKFKYRGKDASARRQQRIEVSIELRKAKKDEHTLKRRNITDAFSKPSSKDVVEGTGPNLDEIVHGMNSPDPVLCFWATQTARKLLSQERNPPLKVIVEAGLVPRLVDFLKCFLYPHLQFEAAWALTNIASGPSELTQAVVDAGAIQPLMELLSSPNVCVCEQAVWALGNIAGDNTEFRDIVISSNIIPHLLALASTTIPITFLRNIAWTLSNLCRNKDPYPCEEAVKEMLPALLNLLQHDDVEVLSDACWALSYLTDGCQERIDQVVAAGVLPRMVELMKSSELRIMTPSLRTVGNIVTGTDQQTQKAIDAGMLDVLVQLLRHPKSSIQKEAAWTLSNVAAGNCQHIEQLINHGMLPILVSLLRNGEFKVQKEAVWVVANFTMGSTPDQLAMLIQSGVLKPLTSLLTCHDHKTVVIILQTIFYILQSAVNSHDLEKNLRAMRAKWRKKRMRRLTCREER